MDLAQFLRLPAKFESIGSKKFSVIFPLIGYTSKSAKFPVFSN